jgi:hypothetical protein
MYSYKTKDKCNQYCKNIYSWECCKIMKKCNCIQINRNVELISFTEVMCMVSFKQSLMFPHKLHVSSMHSIVILSSSVSGMSSQV